MSAMRTIGLALTLAAITSYLLVFRLEDIRRDGFIVREEMYQLLSSSIIKSPSEEDRDEAIRDLVELVLKKLDLDKDHRVSNEDFRQAVEGDIITEAARD